ncbi:bifunctional homocysteine S-methyltransferase/methylenetetrahydrofolate reductase [Paenibacillus thermotolerans]|uniref:bifunctional homocysteine S-methyltransferase/methylenetetrahydrofolate reductase n=1 Tax=Paenibacillus thermotolerans TaxID=3027807 RepID=UPI002367507F|nr:MULTISPECIES: bifunctional homocysteine S-methyltransferase/methylenetetrahydrofolate reductase [unclassified Paenibacillus]
MTKGKLLDVMNREVLVGDGAMGTYLYQLGFPVGISYEELNITKPDVIQSIHRQYVEAGANVLETNTFSANREKLSKFGLEGEVERINRAGVAAARAACEPETFVLGAVGSIRAGKRISIDDDAVRGAFKEQLQVLADTDIDGIILETFYEVQEAIIALRLARQMTDLPVICQLAVEIGGAAQDGVPVRKAFDMLRDEGADIVGFNCRIGPHGIIRLVEGLGGYPEAPLSVFPNAGLPAYVDGRFTYPAGPDYFGESALAFARLGVKLVGGCCGTTPEHIRSIRQAIDKINAGEGAGKPAAADVPSAKLGAPAVAEKPKAEAVPAEAEQDPTLVELVKTRHTVIVELDPPRDLSIDKFMRGARALKEAGVDAITMADNSLAMTRMSNLALGYLVKDKLNMRPLVHIACRDRNLIGTQSHLMGLHALGIDHVLAITGDPARFGDLPGSSSVYDLTSFEIIRMIKQLNDGVSFSGKPLKQKANFSVAAALNPNVRHLHKAVERLEKKIDAGADYVMTQPVYDPELVERLYEATKHIRIPIFIGIMPFTSGRNAEYLHNEVPGITLSDDVRKRMAGLEGEEGRRVSLDISKELLDVTMKRFNGIYLITPFMAYEMTVELTKYIWERTNRRFPLVPTL